MFIVDFKMLIININLVIINIKVNNLEFMIFVNSFANTFQINYIIKNF